MKQVVGTALVLLGSWAWPLWAMQGAGLERLDTLIQDSKQAMHHRAGIAVAVVRDGRIVYQGYFGNADIQRGVAVDADTVFYIASATKPMFALDMLRREAAGELDTQWSLQQMFPATRFQGVQAAEVTLADLLVHRSGLDNPGLVWATAFSGVHDAASRAALVTATRSHPDSPHGTFNYSNVGYNIASVWMQQRFNVAWQQQLDAGIFAPLQMRHTSASIRQARAAGWHVARPYSLASVDPEAPLYLDKVDATLHAAGGVVSTAPDLAQWLLLQLGARQPSGLPPALIARSHEVQITLDARYMDFPRDGYAWGWYVGPYHQHWLLHHFGSFAGFHAHLSFMPDANSGLVVLSNDDVIGAELANLIANYVYANVLGDTGQQALAAERFATLPAKGMQIRERIVAHRRAIQARSWHLSSARQAYAGVYRHPLLGDMHVQVDATGSMRIGWGQLLSVASGAEATDRVRVEFAPNAGVFIDFRRGDAGIDALAFEGNVFVRHDEHVATAAAGPMGQHRRPSDDE